jgi:curved DNA-binding protein
MNYYETLGIKKDAPAADIKSAYRKLAAQHHPDRGGDADKMQTINEAYDTLRDANKRAQYDNPQPQFRGGGSQGFNFNDIFGEGFRQTRQQRNRDITVKAQITIAEMITGKDVIASYRLASGNAETIEMRIPPGARTGVRLEYPNMGDDGIKELPRGNLYVLVDVLRHSSWDVRNNDIYTEQKVNVIDMMLGVKIDFETIDKKKVSLKIPAGTKAGTTFGITDHGVPDLNTKKRGRLLIQIHPDIPQLNDEERAKLQELKDLMSN